MLAGRIKVTTTGGSVAISTPTPGDLVRWERHFGQRISALAPTRDEGGNIIGEGPSLEMLLYLAWLPLKRLHLAGEDFEAWCDDVVELDVNTLGAATPTSPAP